MKKQKRARVRRWRKRVHYYARLFSQFVPLTHNVDGHYIGLSSNDPGHAARDRANRPDVMWS